MGVMTSALRLEVAKPIVEESIKVAKAVLLLLERIKCMVLPDKKMISQL